MKAERNRRIAIQIRRIKEVKRIILRIRGTTNRYLKARMVLR